MSSFWLRNFNSSVHSCSMFHERIQRKLRQQPETMNDDSHPKCWEDVAREKQQEWYESFGDRDFDEYKGSRLEQECMVRSVGYALYGPPDEEPNLDNFGIGYSADKLHHIQAICQTIIKHDKHRKKDDDNDVCVGICFVYMKIDIEGHSHIPTVVFRVLKESKDECSSNIFIDSYSRVYMGWTDYLKNNTLPDCTYCYPRNGVYYGDDDDLVYVEFGITPAGQVGSKVLDAVDVAGTVVSVGATVVGLATFLIPVAAPIMLASVVGGAAVGAYGAGRSVSKIVDLKSHDQSISLKDPEARNCWLSLGANAFGVVAAGATKTAAVFARNGNVLGKSGQFAVNAAQISSLTINGVNIVNTFFILRDKRQSDSLTYLDVFQFSSSILFFTSSVVSLKTAQTIIQENQQSVLKDFETSLRSNRQRKAFARVARNTRKGLDSMHGDAKVIKGITNIKNPADFFSGVIRVQKQYGQNQADVSFSSCGQIEINNQLIVDPTTFAGIDKVQRQTILQATKQFSAGVLSKQQYDTTVNPILHEHGLVGSGQGAIEVTSICKAFGTKSLSDVRVKGRSILSNLDGRDAERLIRFLGKMLSPQILRASAKLAEKLDITGVAHYLHFLEFCNAFIQELLREMEVVYLEMLNIAKNWDGFDQDQFDRDNGIRGDRQEHFINVIVRLHSIGKKFCELRERYAEYCRSHNYNNGGESSSSHQGNM